MSDVLEATVDVLTSPAVSPKSLVDALDFLLGTANKNPTRVREALRAHEGRGWHRVLELLVNSTRPDVLEIAILLLCWAHDDDTPVALTAGQTSRVVERLSPDSPGVGWVCESACALVSMIANTDDGRVALRELGVIPKLVRLLRYTDSPDWTVAGNAVIALGRLARDSTNRGAIVEAGALPEILAMLRSEKTDVVREALGTLGNLGVEASVRATMLESGVVQAIVELLRESGRAQGEESTGRTWTGAAMWCLANLTHGTDPTLCSFLREAGAIPEIVRVAGVATQVDSQRAVGVLQNLCSDRENALAVVGANAVPILTMRMQLTSDEALAQSAAGALVNLCQFPEGRLAILDNGGVTKLAILQSHAYVAGWSRTADLARQALLDLSMV